MLPDSLEPDKESCLLRRYASGDIRIGRHSAHLRALSPAESASRMENYLSGLHSDGVLGVSEQELFAHVNGPDQHQHGEPELQVRRG